MSKNTRLRNLLLSQTRTAFKEILNEVMLTDKERQMMEMFYIERNTLDYIADVMGYTKVGIAKMHRRILEKIERMIVE